MKYIEILFISLLISCSTQEMNNDKRIIPVANAVGTGEILNLSDYAESVKYIPLETTDSLLLGGVRNVMPIGNKFLIEDALRGQASKYYIFDKNGKFIIQVGSIGHGPGQYTNSRAIDINESDKTILLETTSSKCFEYDWNGILIDENKKIDSTEYHPYQTMYMDKNLYISTISTQKIREYKAFVYKKEASKLKIAQTYPNYFQREKTGIDKMLTGTRDGKIYRGENQIRYWRAWDDTVFTIDPKEGLGTAFIFDFGKYKAPLEWMFSIQEDYATVNYIYPEDIKESEDYLFLTFSFGNNAPEKFEEKINALGQGVRYTRSLTNVSVYALFDKNTGRLTLMNQPVKHKHFGFRNDLDNGPVFWPKYISGKDEMVTWFSADKFLSIYETLPNPSAELKTIAEKLAPDDNPVLMVVKLK